MSSLFNSAGSWLFQRSANDQIESVGRDLDNAASEVGRTFSRFMSNIVGRSQTPLTDILEKFGLPKGIFPKNVLRYTFEPDDKSEEGTLEVVLPFVCEVKFVDGHVLRYNTTVACTIGEGKLESIDGIKSQGFFWADVSDIMLKPMSDKIYFQCSTRKSKSASCYEKPRDGVEVEKF